MLGNVFTLTYESGSNYVDPRMDPYGERLAHSSPQHSQHGVSACCVDSDRASTPSICTGRHTKRTADAGNWSAEQG